MAAVREVLDTAYGKQTARHELSGAHGGPVIYSNIFLTDNGRGDVLPPGQLDTEA